MYPAIGVTSFSQMKISQIPFSQKYYPDFAVLSIFILPIFILAKSFRDDPDPIFWAFYSQFFEGQKWY